MSLAVDTKFPPLRFRGDSLGSVINFIEDKNVVALHTTQCCRVFSAISFEQPESITSLKDVRVIYVDCNPHEGVICEGEWECYIKNAVKDVKELSRDNVLRKAIIEKNSVPNKIFLSIRR